MFEREECEIGGTGFAPIRSLNLIRTLQEMSWISPQLSKASGWASSTHTVHLSGLRTKSAIKDSNKRRSTLSVHFADMSGRTIDNIGQHGSLRFLTRNNSDGECSVSNLSDSHMSDSDLPSCDSTRSMTSRQGFRLSQPNGSEEENGEEKCLNHIDELGVTLENTFKEVASIDNYVQKLREDFDHEMLNEHNFMAHICTARMARAACCKKQVSVWQHLQHELIDYCCHYHHIHDHDDFSNISYQTNKDGQEADIQDSGIETLISALNKMSTFELVKQRLEPGGNSKSFVNHWIIHGEDALGHHHFSELNVNNDSDSDSLD